MAKNKKISTQSLPIRSSSHVKEDDSREIFQRFIKPWMISSWLSKDYGIDGIVEIMRPLAHSNNYVNSGKRFSVQVKSSTEINFDAEIIHFSNVPVEKINYWFQSIEPALLVLIDLNKETCYYRWVDELLKNELFHNNENWIAQGSTTIQFNSKFVIKKNDLSELERYVLTYKRSSKTILTPGNYFNYSKDVREYIVKVIEVTNKYKIPFLMDELKELENRGAHTIYTIAIVGPSRAGKSTLINCLLQKQISQWACCLLQLSRLQFIQEMKINRKFCLRMEQISMDQSKVVFYRNILSG